MAAHPPHSASSSLLRPAYLPRSLAFRPARQVGAPGRGRLAVVAGEGRSANRTKWAGAELAASGSAGSGSGPAAVLERPAAGVEEQAQGREQSASELVSGWAGGRSL